MLERVLKLTLTPKITSAILYTFSLVFSFFLFFWFIWISGHAEDRLFLIRINNDKTFSLLKKPSDFFGFLVRFIFILVSQKCWTQVFIIFVCKIKSTSLRTTYEDLLSTSQCNSICSLGINSLNPWVWMFLTPHFYRKTWSTEW